MRLYCARASTMALCPSIAAGHACSSGASCTAVLEEELLPPELLEELLPPELLEELLSEPLPPELLEELLPCCPPAAIGLRRG